jgi:hypothetical protein
MYLRTSEGGFPLLKEYPIFETLINPPSYRRKYHGYYVYHIKRRRP